MWWMLPAATALLGARNAQKKQDAQTAYNKGQAEVTRYSPWTGMKGQLDTSYAPDALEGGLQGGIQGLGMMQAGKAAFGADSLTAPTGGLMNDGSYAGANMLGGQDMAAQLGQSAQFGVQQSPWLSAELQPPTFFAGR